MSSARHTIVDVIYDDQTAQWHKHLVTVTALFSAKGAGAPAAADLWGRQRVNPAVESRLGESVPAGVDRLVFGHQSLGPFDDVAHAVDEALLLRW